MGCRVLVVDNDQDAIDLLVLDLTLEGHAVVGTAMAGAEAVALCAELRPDVLVVDYRMPPGLNGVEVARAVREQPGLRVVIYSNYRDSLLREQAAKAGATYLQKGQLVALRRLLRGPLAG